MDFSYLLRKYKYISGCSRSEAMGRHCPANWRSRSTTVCFTCARNIVFQHKINFCVDVHDDVIKWKHFPRYWPFVRGIHRSPVNSPHKGQWRGALMFSLICVWINGWVNNREAGDLRRNRTHYDVIVMWAHGVYSMCLAVLYLYIIWVHIGFVYVYFEFALLSSTWWTQYGFKSAHREHKKIWTHASTNLLS